MTHWYRYIIKYHPHKLSKEVRYRVISAVSKMEAAITFMYRYPNAKRISIKLQYPQYERRLKA